MNKRLSDEDRREWEQHLNTLQESYGMHEIVFAPVELCALIESEKEGWAEADKWLAEAMKQCPTPDAYDAACKALWKHREDNEKLRKEVERLKEAIGLMHDHHGVLTEQVVEEVKKHSKSCVEHELSIRALKDKLQDALNMLTLCRDTLQSNLRAAHYKDEQGMLNAYDQAQAAIQRIQEEGKQS